MAGFHFNLDKCNFHFQSWQLFKWWRVEVFQIIQTTHRWNGMEHYNFVANGSIIWIPLLGNIHHWWLHFMYQFSVGIFISNFAKFRLIFVVAIEYIWPQMFCQKMREFISIDEFHFMSVRYKCDDALCMNFASMNFRMDSFLTWRMAKRLLSFVNAVPPQMHSIFRV